MIVNTAGFGITPAEQKANDKAYETLIIERQSARRQLAKTVKDDKLKVSADGAMGPKTQVATNRALRMYVRAPMALQTGNLSEFQIKTQAFTITDLIKTENQRRVTGYVTPGAPTVAQISKQARDVEAANPALKRQPSAGTYVSPTQSGNTVPVTQDTQLPTVTQYSPDGQPITTYAPDGAPASFFTTYKWPIIGAGTVVLGGIAFLLMRRKPTLAGW